ncbi:MAG: molybdopterin-dependent oxidoreductase [Rhodothermales bacterium]
MPFDPLTRRAFLRRTGGLVAGVSLTALVGCESFGVEPVTGGIDFLPFITPNETFFKQFGADGGVKDWPGIQQIPQSEWSLSIDGAVASPRTLRIADIFAEAEHEVTILSTLRCILDNNAGQGLVGTATWKGIPLRRFLDAAGVDLTRARRLRFYGADGFTNNLPIERVFGDAESDLVEPLLVYEMNGIAVPSSHGAPIRLLVPGYYGYKSVKWLTRVEVTENDDPFGTYQEVLGYTDDGRIDVSCKTTSILRGARIPAGPARIAGFALSGHGSIDQVRLTIDGGEMVQARILSLNELLASAPDIRGAFQLTQTDRFPYPYRGVWTLWEYQWDATPGQHLIRVQAHDAAGNEQPPSDDDPTDGQNPAFEFNVTVESSS